MSRLQKLKKKNKHITELEIDIALEKNTKKLKLIRQSV